MMQVESLFANQLLQISIVAGFVWLATKTLTRKHAHLSYALWLVVLLKCVTPPVWASPLGVFSWLNAQPRSHEVVSEYTPFVDKDLRSSFGNDTAMVPLVTSPASMDALVAESPLSIESLKLPALPSPGTLQCPEDQVPQQSTHTSPELDAPAKRENLVIWLVLSWLGIAGVLIFGTLIHAAFYVRRLKANQVDGGELESLTEGLSEQLNLRRPAQLLVTSCSVGPAVIGLFRPLIVIPQFIVERSTADKLKPILAHELIHVRRGDLWVGLFRCFVRSLWWFHPLVWKTSNAVRRGAERCCDEEVIASLNISPRDYAQALIGVLELRQELKAVPCVPGVRPFDITSKRLETIMKLRQGSRSQTPRWCWAIAMLLAMVSLPGAGLMFGDERGGDSEETPEFAVELIDQPTNSEADVLTKPSRTANETATDVPPKKSDAVLLTSKLLTANAKEIDGLSVPWQVRLGIPSGIAKTTDTSDVERKAKWGESRLVVEKRLPIYFAIIDDTQVANITQKIAKTKVISRPQIITRDRASARCKIGHQQTFVVGVEDDQPVSREYSFGLEADLLPKIIGDSVQLSYRLKQSRLRSVEKVKVQIGGMAFNVEIPAVENSLIVGENVIPQGKTLLVRMHADRTDQNADVLLAMIKPEPFLARKMSDSETAQPTDVGARRSTIPDERVRAVVDEVARCVSELGEKWPLSLDECVSIALQNSHVTRSLGLRVVQPLGQTATYPKSTAVLARISTDTTLADADINLRDFLFEVTQNYWSLYFCHQRVTATRDSSPQAISNKDGSRQAKSVAIKSASWRLNSEHAKALLELDRQEKRLRYLLGIAAKDDRLIMPVDEPVKARVEFDWDEIKTEALKENPELRRQRWRVRQSELQLIAARNQLLPHFDAVALYRFLGEDSAKKQLEDNSFSFEELSEWRIGFTYQQPIGFRAEMTQVWNRQLELNRSKKRLEDLERELIDTLSNTFARVADRYLKTQSARDTLKTASSQFDAARMAAKSSLEDNKIRQAVVHDAKNKLDRSELAYFQSIVEYQLAITEIHHRKGSLLQLMGCELSEKQNDGNGESPNKKTLDRSAVQPPESLTLNPDFSATAYDIAVQEASNTGVEAALSAFDSQLKSRMTSDMPDQPYKIRRETKKETQKPMSYRIERPPIVSRQK